MKQKIEGLGVAIATPFDDAFNVDYAGFERLLDGSEACPAGRDGGERHGIVDRHAEARSDGLGAARAALSGGGDELLGRGVQNLPRLGAGDVLVGAVGRADRRKEIPLGDLQGHVL